MLFIDRDAERVMQAKKREILDELENAKLRILQELSGVDRITLTRLRSMLNDYDRIEKKVDEKIDNMETIVESISHGATKTAFLSKSELATNVIQSLINSGAINTLIIDTDITLTSPLVIPSNFTVKGDGGTIYCTGGEAFKVKGTSIGETYVDSSTNYAEKSSNTIYDVTLPFEVGDTIFIQGSQNLVSRSAFTSTNLREKYFLCEGTESANMKNAVAGMMCKVSNRNDHKIDIDTPFAWYFGHINVVKVKPAENVVFDGVKIVNTSESVNTTGIIEFTYARNCVVKGCEITSNNGSIIVTNFSTKISICDNKLSVTAITFTNHAENNMIRIRSTSATEVVNNIITGGTQNIDITYAPEGTVSYGITVRNNTIYAKDTGITTHPATFRCFIDSNSIFTERKGIAVRGHYHTLSNNVCVGTYNGGEGYGIGVIEGFSRYAKIYGNTVKFFRWGIYVHEDNSNGRDNTFPASLNVDVTGNTFENCESVIYIRCDENATTEICKLNLTFKNNTVYGDNTDSGAYYTILEISSRGTNRLSGIYITDNTFANFPNLWEMNILTRVNFIIYRNNVLQTSKLYKGNTNPETEEALDTTITGTEDNIIIASTINNGESKLGGMN